MHHILVPTDFNESGRAAFSFAVELSEKFNSKITLLHVLHLAKLAELAMELNEMDHIAYSLNRDASSESEYTRNVERMRQAADDELKRFGDPSWRNKVKVETALVEGRPSVKIVEFATANNVDMISIKRPAKFGIRFE